MATASTGSAGAVDAIGGGARRGAIGRTRRARCSVSGRYSVNVLPCAGRADQADFAAEQRRQLAADGQAQAGAAVLAARAGVGLLERLEDQLLLLRRDADAGVGDRERDRRRRARQDRVIRRPARRSTCRTVIDTWPWAVNLNAFDSRFFRICCSRFGSLVNVRGSVRIDVDVERQVLRLGDVVEVAVDAVAQRART